MHAVRNIGLCTKDCLCLYVCPTGATDTETGQIDPVKCLDGCRVCVDACPSNAISLVPEIYPSQQDKDQATVAGLNGLAEGKIQQAQTARAMAAKDKEPITAQLMEAIALSNELMAEDLLREAGYMLPQSQNVQKLLSDLIEKTRDPEFPKEAAEALLGFLSQNNQ